MNLNILRATLRITTVVVALGGLTACGAVQDNQVFQKDFWTLDTFSSADNDYAELGLAELAKGDSVRAQGYFDKALKANPNDVYAVYGMAVLYQNSGQTARARKLYEQILGMKPEPIEEVLIWADKRTHPIVEVAKVNLQLMENGAMAPMPGAPMPGQAMAGEAMPQSQLYVQPMMPYGQPQQMAQPGQAMQPKPPAMAEEPMFKDADINIVQRFKALRALLDQGLITQDEFVVRRRVNAGALLPLTSSPPASGLDRPVPSVEQISGRLRAIGRALEMRALSPAQHMAERTMILDALMPARPAAVAQPGPSPSGLMQAADAVRRLEMLKEADLITSDEYARERTAIEQAMQPEPMQTMADDKAMADKAEAKPALSGFQPAVHLASYRRQAAADRGWADLQRRFKSLLNGLEHRVEKVDLGGGKGVFYRLKAGPLPSNAEAKELCRKLKAQRQYCEPTTINFG